MNMELADKIKKAISQSSFPIEMRFAQKLKDMGWDNIVGRPYYDFEFDILRETDIVARKKINHYTVNLFIECKKSQDKQLLLYMPYENSNYSDLITLDMKIFPKKEFNSINDIVNTELSDYKLQEYSKLYKIQSKNYFSQNIIFTKGDSIYQDNKKFFTSLYGLIKSSIWFYKEMDIKANKELFLYLIVYDGLIFGLYPTFNENNFFELEEIKYGIYKQNLLFNYSQVNSLRFSDFRKYLEIFGTSYLIQMIHPSFMDEYLQHLEKTVIEFDITRF